MDTFSVSCFLALSSWIYARNDDGLMQKSQSNASQVVIRNVGFGLSGNFSCEVTADAPYFSTATAAVQLQVVGEFSICMLFGES